MRQNGQSLMHNYAASLFYIVLSWFIGLSYSAAWEVGVKCGAAMTFFLASVHMVLKIRGQMLDNKLKNMEIAKE